MVKHYSCYRSINASRFSYVSTGTSEASSENAVAVVSHAIGDNVHDLWIAFQLVQSAILRIQEKPACSVLARFFSVQQLLADSSPRLYLMQQKAPAIHCYECNDTTSEV